MITKTASYRVEGSEISLESGEVVKQTPGVYIEVTFNDENYMDAHKTFVAAVTDIVRQMTDNAPEDI